MLVIYGVRKKQNCFFTWSLSCFVFAIAAVLASMRTFVEQDWLTVFVADLLMILTPLLALHGLRQFQTQQPVPFKHVALVISYSALALVLLYTAPVHAQAFTSTVCAAVFLFAAIYILSIKQAPSVMRGSLFTIFLVHGALMLAQSGMLVQNLAAKTTAPLTPLLEWLIISHLTLSTGTAMLFPFLAFAMSDKRLQEITNFDELTQLFNRQAFLERTGLLLAKSRIQRRPFCLVAITVDSFHEINSQHGHQAGDECLRQVTALIRDYLRDIDVAARMEGPEFAIAFFDLDHNQAELMCYRLCEQVARESFLINGHDMKLSLSVGCIHSSASRRDLGQLMGSAYFAMRTARSKGRNQFEITRGITHSEGIYR